MTLDQQAAILRSELETQYTTPEAAFEALDATLEAPQNRRSTRLRPHRPVP